MRRFKLILLYIVFLCLLAEFGIGHIGYWIAQGEAFSYDGLKKERRNIVSRFTTRGRVAVDLDQDPSPGKRKKYSVEILHPYLGYVVDFHDDQCPTIGFCDDRMRSYLALLQGEDFPEASSDRIIVVITGGSFAYGVANSSTQGKLEHSLATIPEFKDKEILIYTLSLGGYKQPQQLFAVQYYLSMGAHFDMIINIDGFNDIVLPQVENIPFGSNPYFPRLWHERVHRGVEDRGRKALQGRVAYFEEQRAVYANKVNESLFRHSALKNLVWRFKDMAIQKRIAQAEMEYLHNAAKTPRMGSDLLITGTRFPTEDYDLMLARIAEFWRRTSKLLHDIAKANNIKYYHFLQPNQYVANSKPMTEEERKIAYLEGSPLTHPYAKYAELGYPYLISEGSKLRDTEVRFHDLTQVFSDNTEVLYFDACCHLNSKGYDYIIDEIIRVIKSKSVNVQ